MDPLRGLVVSAFGLMGLAQGLSAPGWAWRGDPPHDPGLSADPCLATLIQEALARNPDLARAQVLVKAEGERIPAARALPDPLLGLGLQNDGFKKLQIGMMEGSYYQVMVTQPLPWPGKRYLKGEVASRDAEVSRTGALRTRLDLVADVKRAYVGLLLVRGQLDLVARQEQIWQKAVDITRVRYEVGQGTQADLLRAQLESSRLRQTRISLMSEGRVRTGLLNRLRDFPADAPIDVKGALPDPSWDSAAPEAWMHRAERESPELESVRIRLRQADQSLALARRERYPDFAVSAGIMPRGGLEPMWQVGVSVSLPVWSSQKQQRAIAEQALRQRAGMSEVQRVGSLIAQRIQERCAQQEGVRERLALFKAGLLVQSEASYQAALAQYEGGRGSFLAVLEALNGWIADQSAYLQTVAEAHALQIAQEAFDLDATPPMSATSLGSAPMGMSGAGAMSAPSRPPGMAPRQAPGGASTMPSM